MAAPDLTDQIAVFDKEEDRRHPGSGPEHGQLGHKPCHA